MPSFRDLEAKVSQVVFSHLGDSTTYTFVAGGSVATTVQVYERAHISKDDSVRGLSAATSRLLNAAETVTMVSLLAADVPLPRRNDSFVDQGVTYYIEHVLESTPFRHECVCRRG